MYLRNLILRSPRDILVFAAGTVLLLAQLGVSGQSPQPGTATAKTQGPKLGAPHYVGNEACTRCHAEIVQKYSMTAMAHASGPAAENFVSGSLSHKESGMQYRIYNEDGKLWLSFERPGDPQVHGRHELLYFIGQGRRGRTYLFMVDGFLFESPVNWYTDRHLWDMAPAYSDTRQAPMNLPALASCLDCHVSGVKPPIEGTENRYTLPVFAYSGVTCERCHGPGSEHVNGGPIVNPAKLSPSRRDAVCMQCHLEGNVAIERSGKHLYDYRPGDDLSDFVRYYVRTDRPTNSLGAVSQFEALSQSMCKRKAGEAMSCTSCHDPHRSVAPEERVAFYRGKCLACHGAEFGAKHHPDRPDCTACHMPASLSTNIAHTEVTDHRIQRRPVTGPALENAFGHTASDEPQLRPFPDTPSAQRDTRDLALAWDSLAETGTSGAEKQAEQLLRQALKDSPDDPAMLAALGYIEQTRGSVSTARELYQRALKQDPTQLEAASDLGVLEAREGHMRDAVTLWNDAFRRAPGRSSIGMNLARTYCAAGHFDRARDYTMRVLQFNPDLGSAKKLLNNLNGTPAKCGP